MSCRQITPTMNEVGDFRQLAVDVMRQCDAASRCSEEPDRITRRCFTAAMEEIHSELTAWMEDAGLRPRRDEAGNLIGRRDTSGEDRVLLLGSHLDSVPGAGRYDGVLGVLMGVAVAKALRDSSLPFHLDVIGFCEEEGVRFSKPYLGSSAVAGCFRQEWFDRVDSTGVKMRDALSGFGVEPDQIGVAAYPSERVIGYIEPHLEQGPVLERTDKPLGIVSGIAGQSRLRVGFRGEAGHAGTTPMPGRRDALVAGAALVSAVRAIAENTEGLRATVGRFEIFPNTPNVIPEQVEMSLDVRHPVDTVRESAIKQILAEAARIGEAEGCGFSLLENAGHGAVAVDDQLTETLAEAVSECGCDSPRVLSGAGHDAVVMASSFPVAMLFVRHPGAVSHHPDERVEPEDVAAGIEALTRFVLRMAEKHQEPASMSVAQ